MSSGRRTNLLLLFGTILTLVLLGELLVRLTDAAPQVALIEKWRYRLAANPRIGFEPIPNLDSTHADVQYFSYRGASNSLGFRDREHPVEKPPNTVRVLILGDSVAAGLWVNDDTAIFPAVLERTLIEGGMPAEIMNMSVAGYNTLQEIETLKEKGLPYRPDVVLVAYCQNDRERDDGHVYEQLLYAERHSSGISHTRFSPYLLRSALYRYLVYRLNAELRKRFERYQYNEWMKVGEDAVEPSLAELARLSREHGFRALIVLFPKFSRDGKTVESTPESQALSAIAEKNGLEFLDLESAYRECNATRSAHLAYDAFHSTPAGHRCAGEAIAKYLNPPS